MARAFLVVAVMLGMVAGPTAGCGSDRSDVRESGAGAPGQAGPGTRARPVITPGGKLVSEDNSGDLPDATAQVCRECQRGLGKSDARLAPRMERVAKSRSGSNSTKSDSAKAVALNCAAAARANESAKQGAQGFSSRSQKNAELALENADKAKAVEGAIPASIRTLVAGLGARAELVAAATLGQQDRVRAALKRLEALGYEAGDYLRDACAVAADPAAIPECESATPSGGETEAPSDEPETTVTSETETPPTEEGGETDDGDTQQPDEKGPTDEVAPAPPVDGDDPAPAET